MRRIQDFGFARFLSMARYYPVKGLQVRSPLDSTTTPNVVSFWKKVEWKAIFEAANEIEQQNN